MLKSCGKGAIIMQANKTISTFVLANYCIFRHRKAHAMCELYSFY